MKKDNFDHTSLLRDIGEDNAKIHKFLNDAARKDKFTKQINENNRNNRGV